ncbi:MAG TPA: DUF58 domain-containing protein [Flavitalea sp.]|nr:DUF58 domain-containing protein [Flavitalea sp.]
MKLYANYLKPLFFSRRFYGIFAAIIFLFVLSFFFPPLLGVSRIILFLLFFLAAIDFALLFFPGKTISAVRDMPDRLSNGDSNTIKLTITNHYPFVSGIQAIDELPVQFQQRGFSIFSLVRPGEEKTFAYALRPVERGEYVFEDINVFARSPLGLLVKREIIPSRQMVKVYPSYFALRRYELLAWSNQLSESGNRKIRKIGQSVEFEQIKEYVTGDDIRSINWKATARKGGQLMVNNYTDERSQQVYCIIDKGRVMKMPFEGLTLLDYAINSALILSRVALIRQDRAGLLTFAEQVGQFLPAGRKAGQMNSILETLYNQQTAFAETDFEQLYAFTRARITQRSLMVLFTNFESLAGLQRQLPYIRSIARNHLLLVVFFENTELRRLSDKPVEDIEGLYIRTIADKFAYEKRLIIKELQQHGIFTILTAPENLTINTVNKYLEIKASQAI